MGSIDADHVTSPASRDGPHQATPPSTRQASNVLVRAIRGIDRFQQRHDPAAFVFGVLKKFGDDRGGQLSALVAFYGFMSFFPLTLIVVTITSYIARSSPAFAEQLRNSALSQFPVVGTQLAGDEGALPGSGLGLVVGTVGLLWGALGVTDAVQYAFYELWHVPHKRRPPFLLRILRSVILFGLLAAGVLGTTFLALLGTFVTDSRIAGAFGIIGGAMVSVGLYLTLFWLLSPRHLPLRDLLPGALMAGVGWQVLQVVGVRLVQHQLRRSSELYGAIGVGLGLISFLVVGSQVMLYAAELTIVRQHRLWPRSLVQPPLTDADRRVLSMKAMQEERRPEERVTVDFGEG